MLGVCLAIVGLPAWPVQAQLSYQQLRAFGNTNTMAAKPNAPVIEASDGLLYGTTFEGGATGTGAVFSMNKNGTGLAILHSFGAATNDGRFPSAAVLEGSDGLLYGVTTEGGSAGMGILFKMARDGTGYTILRHFSGGTADGQTPSAPLIEGSDGVLYGVCPRGGSSGFGTIFKINKNGTGYSVMQHFAGGTGDGENPFAPLLEGSDGVLYGNTEFGGKSYTDPFSGVKVGAGTVFKISKNGTGYDNFYKFATTGNARHPTAPMIEGTNGMLYGTSAEGGTEYLDEYGEKFTAGVVFRLTKSGTYQTVRQFLGVNDAQNPAGGVMQASDGLLYGTTAYDEPNYTGTIFRMNLDGTGYSVLFRFGGTNGLSPGTALIEASDGQLYGTTSKGGKAEVGTVFRFDRTSSTHVVLHHFSPSGGDPGQLDTPLIEGSDGWLYGVSRQGGDDNAGTVFKVSPSGTGFAILHSFLSDGFDGSAPVGPLVEGSDQVLYGVTTYGGTNSTGTIFKLNKDGTGYGILVHFALQDGQSRNPAAGLIESADGMLYGTTSLGGYWGRGTVFRVNKDGTGLAVQLSFSGSGAFGRNPNTPLLEASDDYLYGTTPAPAYTAGSTSPYGTVFRLRRDGTDYSVVRSFTGATGDGRNPGSGLIEGAGGWLYGTTREGGSAGVGTVYRLRTNLSAYEVLRSFTTTSNGGNTPIAGVQAGPDGGLYGTTSTGGSSGGGIVYRMGTNGSNFEILHHFGATVNDGRVPEATLILATDNRLYGTTAQGGQGNLGTLFRYGSPLEPPAVTQSPSSQTVTNGATVHFTVSATGDDLQYQWQRNSLDIPGATNSELILPAVGQAQAGTYRVAISNAVDSVLSQPAVLTVLEPPTISTIPDQFTAEDTDLPVSFTIGDVESPATALTVTAQADNPELLPPASLQLSGSESNRTLTITPALNQSGSATITVIVQDLDGLSASTSFLLTVQPVNDPPVIDGIPDQSTDEDTPIVVPFILGDVESPATALTVTAQADNPELLPPASLQLSGSDANRSLTLRPATNQFGTATITIRVTDAESGTEETTFELTVHSVPDLPRITSEPQDITVVAGETAMLTVAAEGLPPLGYQWQRESTALPGETNVTLVIDQAQPSNAGGYSVLVTGPEGSVTSRTAQLRLLVAPNIGGMLYADGQASFSFVADRGYSYIVESTDTLDLPVWTAWPPIVGEGERVLFIDTNAPPASRFYRLRVE